MSKRAWAYVIGVIALGIIASILAFRAWTFRSNDLLTLAVLVVLATLSNLFKSLFKSQPTPDKGATFYSPFLLFVFAGAVLLPSALYMVLVCVTQLIEWVNERRKGSPLLKAWYIQPFNMATFVLCGLGAHAVFTRLAGIPPQASSTSGLLAGIAAGVVFVLLNHLMVGLVLLFARGVSFVQSQLFTFDSLMPDLVMMGLGYTVAVFWTVNPWLIIIALSPFWLLRQALRVMQLQKEAHTDEKTSLLNARRFNELFTEEFKRAHRFGRPLTLIFADLDLLRDINNTHGHLAGDMALTKIGEVIRHTIRDYDIAGRFGGEEFAIALTETFPAEGERIAEAIRADIERAVVQYSPHVQPINISISLGVACFPLNATSAQNLIEAADQAMYAAKQQGRNRVVSAFTAADAQHYEEMSGHSKPLNLKSL